MHGTSQHSQVIAVLALVLAACSHSRSSAPAQSVASAGPSSVERATIAGQRYSLGDLTCGGDDHQVAVFADSQADLAKSDGFVSVSLYGHMTGVDAEAVMNFIATGVPYFTGTVHSITSEAPDTWSVFTVHWMGNDGCGYGETVKLTRSAGAMHVVEITSWAS